MAYVLLDGVDVALSDQTMCLEWFADGLTSDGLAGNVRAAKGAYMTFLEPRQFAVLLGRAHNMPIGVCLPIHCTIGETPRIEFPGSRLAPLSADVDSYGRSAECPD